MKTLSRLLMVSLLAVSLASCASMEKAPAEAAMATAQVAFDAVKDNASKVMPDETKTVQDAFDAAKASLDKGDYKAALEAAKALPGQVKGLADQVDGKMTAMKGEWESMSAGLPAAMASIDGVVSKMKSAPKGMDAAAWDGLKTNLNAAGQTWKEAQAAAESGDLATAMSKAGDVKKVATDAMMALKMPMPDAMK